MQLRLAFAIALAVLAATVPGPRPAFAARSATMHGTVYRGDKQHPVANADVELVYDHKEDKTEEEVTARTDANGNYHFDRLLPEGYHVEIHLLYDRAEEVPCKFEKARTIEKPSVVTVTKLGEKYAELIYLNSFWLHSGQAVVRDFDITCFEPGK